MDPVRNHALKKERCFQKRQDNWSEVFIGLILNMEI
jgi:hypothetical protein